MADEPEVPCKRFSRDDAVKAVQRVALATCDAGFNYWSSSAFLRALRIIGPNTNRAITRMMSHSQITATTQLVGTRRVSSSNQFWTRMRLARLASVTDKWLTLPKRITGSFSCTHPGLLPTLDG